VKIGIHRGLKVLAASIARSDERVAQITNA